MKILFVDLHCPTPYDMQTLDDKPLGGTEATVIRIADSLRAQGEDVFVTQHNREHNFEWYVTPDILLQTEWRPDHVVVLRSNQALPFIKQQFPYAQTYSWLHDWIDAQYVKEYAMLQEFGTQIVCVSDTHKGIVASLIRDCYKLPPYASIVNRIYNPVMVNHEAYKDVEKNPNKLVFFSSPHKGLSTVIKHFRALRQSWPELELHIANPGYYQSAEIVEPGIINHGTLTHSEVMKHVAESFAVLYLQRWWAETFGLVFAEANAVGTPVIAYNHGSAREVLGPKQVFDHDDITTSYNIIENWKRDGAPKVEFNPEFHIDTVTQQWLKLFRTIR